MRQRRAQKEVGFALLLALLVALAFFAAHSRHKPTQGKREKLTILVTKVYDGDTVRVANGRKVRLIGVDTPEVYPHLEPFGKEAAEKTKALTLHQRVTLIFEGRRFDRYGRWLAYIQLPNGELLSEVLLNEGLAVTFRRFRFSKKAHFLALEHKARLQKRGLFSQRVDERE